MRQKVVLIIDDIPDNLKLLSSLLVGQGYEVRKSINGTMALDAIQQEPPDIILLDIMLPDISGYQVCQILKANPAYAGIPIIFMSALDATFDKIKAFELGGSDYITKPFAVAEVIARIKNQLQIQDLQQQILQQNQQLADEIQERKAIEEELRKAEQNTLMALKREHELNELKSQFISIISHEFRTPMATIQSAIDLLRYYPLSPENREKRFRQIESAITHLTHLLERTLFSEELDNQTFQTKFQPVNLVQMTQEVIDQLMIDHNQSHPIQLITQGSLDTLLLEPTLLRQVLTNLISNSIKYSQPGTTISITLCHDHDLTLYVKDQGRGIPKSDQPYLFSLFSRGSNSEEVKGKGLGLAIVHKAVKLMQGQIKFHSELNMGTEFMIQIPTEIVTPSPKNNRVSESLQSSLIASS
jgi:two-component system, sensor histidine kinase and response regulator